MYLDNILNAVGAFELGIQSLRLPKKEEIKPEEKVVLGVMGGPWTMGTSIVAANLRAHGFEVIDAGSDIPPEKIAQVALETNAKIVAYAIYLTHTEVEVAKLEEELWKKGIRHKIRTILSGPAGTHAMAEKYHIDAYVKDVNELLPKVKDFSAELKDEMTSYERVMTSLKHKEPDRVPVMPFAQTFTAKFSGIPFSVYVGKAEKMAEGLLNAYRAFGWDALIFSSDVGRDPEAFGGKSDFPHDDVPRVIKPPLTQGKWYEDYKNLKIPDPWNAGRFTEHLKAIEICKKEVGDEVPLIGWIDDSFQGLALLGGGNPLLLFYIQEHPDEFKEMQEWYLEWELEACRAMHEAGADIIGSGEAAGHWMSPEFFKQFVYGPEKEASNRINRLGMPHLIHCCGYVPQCIHFVKETTPGGAIQFDYQVDLAWAKQLIGDEVTIMGNLNYNKLVNATPQQTYDDCAEHIKIAGEGGGYWLAFGCEIPRDMPPENIRAMMRAAKTVGKYPIQK